MKLKNREDMNWEEEKQLILTFPGGRKMLKIAESCKHHLSGFCCESLNTGRTWTCLFLRKVPKGTEIACSKYVKEV